jgi:hypothetical protein
VLADVNGNDVIDAYDLNELYQYLLGAKTANEILFPEEEEEEEYAPDYQDGFDVNGTPYFPYWDMNDNGIMDAGEILQMTRPLPDGSNQ